MARAAGIFAVAVPLLVAANTRAALPEPPNQHQPWQHPSVTSAPQFVVTVAAALFDAGLADPRGGDYREVEIVARSNGKETIQTHAWVFHDGFAVCWNGLVYRVRRESAAANLERDVQTILSARPWDGTLPGAFRAPGESARSNVTFWPYLEASQTIAPISISLLLRLGRPDLATRLWNAMEASGMSGQPDGLHESDEGFWLATSATAWFGTAYWRLVGAFAAGDDQDALDVAQSILEWRSRVSDRWRIENRSIPRRLPDISFLNPVPELAADAARRLREPKRAGFDLQAIGANKVEASAFFRQPQTTQIAELIERLQDVRGDKIAFPGPLIFLFDPDYELLKREGDAGVEALIKAYGSDKRLTRTFDYSRPWSMAYTPVPVRDVVELLLKNILGDAAVSGKSAPELLIWWRQHHSGDTARMTGGNIRQ